MLDLLMLLLVIASGAGLPAIIVASILYLSSAAEKRSANVATESTQERTEVAIDSLSPVSITMTHEVVSSRLASRDALIESRTHRKAKPF